MSSDLSMPGCNKPHSLIRLTDLSAGLTHGGARCVAKRGGQPLSDLRESLQFDHGHIFRRVCVTSRWQQGLDENRHDIRDLARDGIREMATAAFERVDGDSVQPHAHGSCTNCNRLIIGWSARRWSILAREPCRN